MNEDLKIIKDKYGEEFAHFCRENFKTILEEKGLLSSTLLRKFEPNKYLYQDITNQGLNTEFINYIKRILGYKIEEEEKLGEKTVRELFAEAGYDFFECHTEEEIQKFRRYYDKRGAEYNKYVNEIPQRVGEELCTFDGGRLDSCHVFWAVKKGAENIKRAEFPERQDDYGTSVISIQFKRTEDNELSIKNRYNHTVKNPDATFGNNLENIASGLTDAFEREYGLKEKIIGGPEETFDIPGYVKANDGKLYKYNCKVDPISYIYYCPDNIIIDNGEVIRLDKSKYILMDCFIYDKIERKMFQYNREEHKDAFIDGFTDLDKVEIDENNKQIKTKFQEERDKQTGIRKITITPPKKEPIIIEVDKYGRIISYKNSNITQIGSNFMNYVGNVLKKIEIPNVTEIADSFLYANKSLESIDLPNVEKIGTFFLYENGKLKELKAQKLQIAFSFFLTNNSELKELDLPSLISVRDYFLEVNSKLEKINLPKLEMAGEQFLHKSLKEHGTTINCDFSSPNFEKEETYITNHNLKIINIPNIQNKEILQNIKEVLIINNPKPEKQKRNISSLKIFKHIKEKIALYKAKRKKVISIGENNEERIEGEEYNDEITNNKQR